MWKGKNCIVQVYLLDRRPNTDNMAKPSKATEDGSGTIVPFTVKPSKPVLLPLLFGKFVVPMTIVQVSELVRFMAPVESKNVNDQLEVTLPVSIVSVATVPEVDPIILTNISVSRLAP